MANSDPNAPVLDAKNVTIRFGGLTAVSNFNLAIRPNELVGLIGPNGAGKTTIFNMLTGVYKPTEGEIIVGGVATHTFKPYQITALGVARTFQNIRLFKELSVLENVKIGGHIHYKYSGTSAVLHTNRFEEAEAVAERDAMKLLDIFGLRPRAREWAKNLPYGDQRRLEIARALAARPKLLLLDEPAAGLNDSETRDLMATIASIRDRFHVAILLIEHNMELVMGICERIVVLNFGKTIAEGKPEAIRSNPLVIEAYLGEPAGAETETA
jgi:branched-chain amino acid transport system ATP-binding protein